MGVGALTLGLVILALLIAGYRSPSIGGSIGAVVLLLLGVWKTLENRPPASHAVLKAELLRTFREVPPRAQALPTDPSAAAEGAPRTLHVTPAHRDDLPRAPDA